MGYLSKLPNIGGMVEAQLNEVGITTPEQLRNIGSKQAWLKIKAIDASACIHRLYALEGAIQGIKKTQLSIDKKEELKEFYNQFKA
ncbi:DNA transformation protein [Lachnotalea glycerini]|uniref:Competence protein TfoX n=1 Tax=Lachnotalea glycerini TaxID=1763509 RepID=A0A255I8B1_9FIRM|nr:TfoX/Sxy family protein [Lachnotalea glycerini]PXV96086.1 DNA transformation protein [Lachnotalea glycerini]RDY29977.1 competence protein TfoX [Lachnotalea glycerini]